MCLFPQIKKKWEKIVEIFLSFTVKGFSNLKNGTIGIKKHEVTGSHKGAFLVIVVTPSTCVM